MAASHRARSRVDEVLSLVPPAERTPDDEDFAVALIDLAERVDRVRERAGDGMPVEVTYRRFGGTPTFQVVVLNRGTVIVGAPAIQKDWIVVGTVLAYSAADKGFRNVGNVLNGYDFPALVSLLFREGRVSA